MAENEKHKAKEVEVGLSLFTGLLTFVLSSYATGWGFCHRGDSWWGWPTVVVFGVVAFFGLLMFAGAFAHSRHLVE